MKNYPLMKKIPFSYSTFPNIYKRARRKANRNGASIAKILHAFLEGYVADEPELPEDSAPIKYPSLQSRSKKDQAVPYDVVPAVPSLEDETTIPPADSDFPNDDPMLQETDHMLLTDAAKLPGAGEGNVTIGLEELPAQPDEPVLAANEINGSVIHDEPLPAHISDLNTTEAGLADVETEIPDTGKDQVFAATQKRKARTVTRKGGKSKHAANIKKQPVKGRSSKTQSIKRLGK